MELNVAIRADATPSTGGGHIMRCLSLAQALARDGDRVTFLSRPESATTVSALARSGHAVVTVEHDTPAALARQGLHFDALVVDSYAIGAVEERACRSWARIVVALDDLADRPHDCDLLLDQNFGRNSADYTHLVPPRCTVLAGTQYALLRPEFAVARTAALLRRDSAGTARRVLVSLGLTDVGGIAGRLVPPLLQALPDIAFDVVVGSTAPSLSTLRAIAAREPRLALHADAPDICDLMAAADLAVGAGGSTAWERCCLGLPTVTVLIAENQRSATAALEAAGATVSVDALAGDPCAAVAKHCATMAASGEWRIRMTQRASAICDGEGASRVAAALRARAHNAGARLRLRPARADDAGALHDWRNDPVSVAMSITGRTVTWDDHFAWFERTLRNPSRCIVIGEVGTERVGMCRFDREPDGAVAVVSIALAPGARGRRLSAPLLESAIAVVRATWPDLRRLIAHIHRDNCASLALFRGAGFEGRIGDDAYGRDDAFGRYVRWLDR